MDIIKHVSANVDQGGNVSGVFRSVGYSLVLVATKYERHHSQIFPRYAFIFWDVFLRNAVYILGNKRGPLYNKMVDVVLRRGRFLFWP